MHITHLIGRNSAKSAGASDGERRTARASREPGPPASPLLAWWVGRAKQLAAKPLRRADKLKTARLVNAAIGAAISGLAAVGVTMVAEGHPWKDMVPLVFTAVLLLIAAIFGVRAGVIGTVLAALVFAAFLFSPAGSLSVAND